MNFKLTLISTDTPKSIHALPILRHALRELDTVIVRNRAYGAGTQDVVLIDKDQFREGESRPLKA
jgi:hypothetical protein